MHPIYNMIFLGMPIDGTYLQNLIVLLIALQFQAIAASYVKLQLREVKLKPNPAIKSNRINAIAINNVQYANQI